MKLVRLTLPLILAAALILPPAWAGQSTRQKVIDFDGDVVEGVNKRPFDSLNEAIDGNRKSKKIHLYRKRKGFRTETQETIREMRYL
jgi:hypothetical protein